jgi:hypothetical protein
LQAKIAFAVYGQASSYYKNVSLSRAPVLWRVRMKFSAWTSQYCSGWLYHQPTKMEQMTERVMERLLVIREKLVAKMMAKLDAYQEKMDAWLEEMKDD